MYVMYYMERNLRRFFQIFFLQLEQYLRKSTFIDRGCLKNVFLPYVYKTLREAQAGRKLICIPFNIIPVEVHKKFIPAPKVSH